MNDKHYTSLEISKLIHECVPEVSTEKLHVLDGKGEDGWSILHECCASDMMHSVFEKHPAYSLDDVLRAVQVWGEKQGWEKDGNQCQSRCGCIEGGTAYHEGVCVWKYEEGDVTSYCHTILTAYLADGMTFGPESERVIKSIFTTV